MRNKYHALYEKKRAKRNSRIAKRFLRAINRKAYIASLQGNNEIVLFTKINLILSNRLSLAYPEIKRKLINNGYTLEEGTFYRECRKYTITW